MNKNIKLVNSHACDKKNNFTAKLIRSSCRFAVLAFCYTSLTILPSNEAVATNYKLKEIAQSFVKTVNKGFEKADSTMQQVKSGKFNALVQKAADTIQPGEELIFTVLVGKHKIPLKFDIIAIKEKNDILISLTDFFAAADLAISVNPKEGNATGWFIRENQDFYLDANKETITIMGTTVQMPSGSVIVKNNDIYATSYSISRWFNMKFIIDFRELMITLTTSQPLPAEERYARRNRKKYASGKLKKPELPYKKQDYKMFSVPSVDVSLRSSYSRFQNGRPIRDYNWSALSVGDLAYLETSSFISGDEEDIINNARITFSRESEKPDMFGPLKIQKFSFGDVYSTRLPLTGSSVQEQGIRITNRADEAISSFTTTIIRGNHQPGWDVELYRDDRFIAFQTVGDDGVYNFEDISLFIGNNNFRIVFYGPQGEIEERREIIPVNKNNIAAGESSYDISITRNNEITYRKYPYLEPENGEPHIVARYDKSLGKYGTMHAGFRHRQEEYDKKTYIEAGISTNFKDMLINASTAVDATNGGTALDLTARRRIGAHSLNANFKVNSDNYNLGNEPISPIVLQTRLDANGNININPISKVINSTYGMKLEYWEKANGISKFNTSGSIGTRAGSTIVNTGASYSNLTDEKGIKTNYLEANLNMRGFMKRMRWRFKTNYQIIPKPLLRSVYGYVSYPFTADLEGFLQLEHFAASNRTEATVNLNWKTEKATITPRITIDNKNTIRASVNARFGIGYEPISHDVSLYNKSIANNGHVAARVFLDKDGDGIFNKDDELLPNIELDAVQSSKTAKTNDKGIAFIADLPVKRLTDIKLDRGTFEDPFWVPSFKGVSIKPRKGATTTLDFPITVAGEIDGYVYLKDSKGKKQAGRQYTLHLVTPDGKEIQKTSSSYDGFYIFSTVPAGTYFLIADYNDAKNTKYTMPPPKIITIQPNGTSIYGENIILSKGPAIDFRFISKNKPETIGNAIPPAPEAYTASVALGKYNTKLAMSIDWYKLKVKYPEIGKYFEPVEKISQIKPDKNNKYILRLKLRTIPIMDIETAHIACTRIAEKNIPCTVEITSTYQETTVSAENENRYLKLIKKILN